MKTLQTIACIFTFLLLTLSCGKKSPHSLSYPETKKSDSVDVYFGHKVADPYRWLEDGHSSETSEWIEAQNEITFSYLEQIPFRDDLKKRLTEVWSYTSQTAPSKKGDHLFYYRHDGIQNHAVLYTKNIHDQLERVLIDPNLFSEDGTTSLAMASVSSDGNYVAYGISQGGSDWREVYVRDVRTGIDLDDQLNWVKFSGLAWDEHGFYYSRYDEPKAGDELSASNEYQKVYYHRLGTSQDEDVLIFEDPDHPQMNFSLQVDDDHRFLLLYSRISTQGNNLLIKDLHKNSGWMEADIDFETQSSYVATKGDQILVRTNYEAPRYQLMSVNPRNPSVDNWKMVLPEKGNVLRSVAHTDNYLIAHYMVDVQSELKVYNLNGEYLYNVPLPGAGTASGLQTFEEEDLLYYSFASYTTPRSIYQYDITKNQQKEYFVPEVDFDANGYEVHLIFTDADDGAQIPMFIVHKSGIEKDGTHPTILYGYGGFNVVPTPGFDPRLVPWLENGGIYVCAHIRGGGEYGEGWYRGGIRKNKQRVFDDFILAAEYLINAGYTSNEKLAILGGSNGGLLVGAVANQRPELFKVALPAVGVMDMLRYHNFTIGWAWAGDYGRSDDSEEMFKYLYNYSPLHNIEAGSTFPATLVTTADHDDRVVPAHSFKYIATLQEKYQGPHPVLIRIETRAGHGAGKPLSMQIEEVADRWAFTLYNMGESYSTNQH